MTRDGSKYAALSTEQRDCSVRALSIATGRSYEECHQLFAQAGRTTGRGTSVKASRIVHEARLGLTPITTYREWGYPTLHYFAETHPTGRYILHTSTHAFALVDGVVHDWSNGAGSRQRIKRAWEVPTAG
jgi:hypothetical protein